MRYFFALLFSGLTVFCFAQVDSVRVIEPNKETSFDNYELLAVAIVGFLLLVGFWIWLRRRRKKQR